MDFCSLKIQFVELDFYNLIFQKSSIDQQGVCVNQEKELILHSYISHQNGLTVANTEIEITGLLQLASGLCDLSHAEKMISVL